MSEGVFHKPLTVNGLQILGLYISSNMSAECVANRFARPLFSRARYNLNERIQNAAESGFIQIATSVLDFEQAEPNVNDDSFFRTSDDDISSFDLVTDKTDRRAHIADLVQTIKETADK